MPRQHHSTRTIRERADHRDHRWLKCFRAALRDRPENTGAEIGLEGPHMVEEALRSGIVVDALLVSTTGERHLTRLKALLPAGLRVVHTTDRLFASAAGTQTPQGIAALARPRAWKLEELLEISAVPLLVVLCGVQDPGNVGTVVRAAEAFGANGIVTSRGCAHPLGPKALRASAGSALRLPLAAGCDPVSLLHELRRRGLYQIAASVAGATPLPEARLVGPCALWIGSEGAGLPREVEAGADVAVRIPLASPVESLNAGVAAAILLYEAARQRAQAAPSATRTRQAVR
jgi:TrmH family RNA methyltransferase